MVNTLCTTNSTETEGKIFKLMTLVYRLVLRLIGKEKSRDLGGNRTHDRHNSGVTALPVELPSLKAFLKGIPGMTCCHLWLSLRCSNYLCLITSSIIETWSYDKQVLRLIWKEKKSQDLGRNRFHDHHNSGVTALPVELPSPWEEGGGELGICIHKG